MDETDYTIPRHAFAASLPYVELEIRQDLIAKTAGQHVWNRRLSVALEIARSRFSF
jgi:predicted N-formylglutamate amidohydrolase